MTLLHIIGHFYKNMSRASGYIDFVYNNGRLQVLLNQAGTLLYVSGWWRVLLRTDIENLRATHTSLMAETAGLKNALTGGNKTVGNWDEL